MSEEDDLMAHHLKLWWIYQDLRVARDPLLESEFAMTLITSLPPSWDNFIASIDFKDLAETDDKKRMAAVNSIISRIKGEANCRKSQNTSAMPAAFNSAKFGSNTNDSKSRLNKSNSECRYCRKKGHWIKEC